MGLWRSSNHYPVPAPTVRGLQQMLGAKSDSSAFAAAPSVLAFQTLIVAGVTKLMPLTGVTLSSASQGRQFSSFQFLSLLPTSERVMRELVAGIELEPSKSA